MGMLATAVHKDCEGRSRRQQQGIDKVQANGKLVRRKLGLKKHTSIASLLAAEHNYSIIQELLDCSRHLIN